MNLITQTKYYCLMKRQQPSNRQENLNKEEMTIQWVLLTQVISFVPNFEHLHIHIYFRNFFSISIIFDIRILYNNKSVTCDLMVKTKKCLAFLQKLLHSMNLERSSSGKPQTVYRKVFWCPQFDETAWGCNCLGVSSEKKPDDLKTFVKLVLTPPSPT